MPQSELDGETVKKILVEYRIHNADVILKEDCTSDDLIDCVEGNRVYVPCIYLLNKIDQVCLEFNLLLHRYAVGLLIRFYTITRASHSCTC